MILEQRKYTYNDLSIVPTKESDISSRSQCNPFVGGTNMLPLFTAPMDSVVGMENYSKWDENGIHVIIPRTINLETRLNLAKEGYWIAVSLNEFKANFVDTITDKPCRVLIDVANGHMKIIYDLVKEAKKKNKNLAIMVGNIANPETYRVAQDAGVDYIRCGIGAGKGCITSSNTSIHFPMASLISETYEVKKQINGTTKIVADGGIRNYSDIIIALALGADYVMVGSVFTKMLESAALTYFSYTAGNGEWFKFKYDPQLHKYEDGRFYDLNVDTGTWDEIKLKKEFYGMASKKGQIAMNGRKTRTAEGLSTILPVEYTMESWTNNFKDYLKSAMSYTGCHTLEEFIGKQTLIVVSEGTKSSVNK